MTRKKKKVKAIEQENPDAASVAAAEHAVAGEDGDVTDEADTQKVCEAPQDKAGTAEESVGQVQDRLLRLQADFDNFRRRTLREKSQIYRNANEDIMLEFLPVLDHLELALSAVMSHGADDAFLEGFKLVSEQMASVLAKFGLTVIDAEQGGFDPNCHEAVSHLPSADVPPDEIIAQVRRGYTLGDRVLRAAQVVVSSGSASADGDVAETSDTEDATSEKVAVADDTNED